MRNVVTGSSPRSTDTRLGKTDYEGLGIKWIEVVEGRIHEASTWHYEEGDCK